MEQNNYQVHIEALPQDIQAIVQRHIKGSRQGIRLINCIQCNQLIDRVQGTWAIQQRKSTIHPQKYAINEALRHVHMAWQSKSKLIRQNTQFNVLQDKQAVIPPAKFTRQYDDIKRFLNDICNYLDNTKVKSTKWQVVIVLSRMNNNGWVNHICQTVEEIQDEIPYVWDHFVKLFKSHFTQEYLCAEAWKELLGLQMNGQALETYANHFKMFTDTLGISRDADIFLALFIQGLTEQLHQTIRLNEVYTVANKTVAMFCFFAMFWL